MSYKLSSKSLSAVLHDTTQLLTSAGFDTPRLDAEVLLAYVLGWNRARLLANLDYHVTEEYHDEYKKLLNRRLNKEPVAYIRGIKEFYSLDFFVNPNVLIPRPETELLVDMAIEWLENNFPINKPDNSSDTKLADMPVVVDIGTGSGNIAITLAKLCKDIQVIGIDFSDKALEIARENAKRLGVFHRIEWFSGDLLQPLSHDIKINLIVANLPYVPTSDWEKLSPNVKMEPRLALDGGEDGLDLIRSLLQQVPEYLGEPHAILLEVGPGQVRALANSPEMKFYSIVETRNDLQGIPRALHLKRKS